MNTSLYRVVLVSVSLCWVLLAAKTNINDQVDQSVLNKLAAEEQLTQIGTQEPTKISAPEKNNTSISISSIELSASELAAKEALANEIEANKVVKEMAVPQVIKDAATPLTSDQSVELTKVEEAIYSNDDKSLFDPKLEDYISQGLGRIENNIIISGNGSRDGSVTLTGADAYGDGWSGNELCIEGGGCYAVEGSSGSWDLGVLASGDYAVTCGGGSWGSEVSWAFTDAAGNTLLSGSVGDATLTVGDSGCTDADAHSLSVGGGSWGSEVGWSIDGTGYAGSVGDVSLCLANGDYTFQMTDAYGDGWNGNTAVISNADGDVVASGGLDDGSAGSFDFSLGTPVVAGCTDSEAPNYDADATVDDGSCEDGCYNLGDWGSSCASYIQNYGYTCEEMIGYGYDCSDYDTCFPGECPEPDPCATAGGNPGWVDDGWCDTNNNVADCGYDGGDCCPSTCLDNTGGYAQPDTCENYASCDTCLDETASDGYDDCGVCNGSNDCADCAGVPNGDAFADCVGTCIAGSYVSWIGDGYCDDGTYGVDYVSCGDFNCDNGDCGTELLDDGTCGTPDPNDCAGVSGGDSFEDCAGTCLAAGYVSWIGDGYCDDGAYGVDYVSCGDFNCDNGDCGTELLDDGTCGTPATCSDYSVSVGGGSWGSEVSWDLSSGASGGVGEYSLCLEDGDYTLYMHDAYGDGWNGNSWSISSADGLINSFTLDDGSEGEAAFSLPGEVDTTVYGCMLEGAPNYNADAEEDDGTCEYFAGANYGYWNAYYSNYYIGCGLYYIFADDDGDGVADAVGDGLCDDLGYGYGLACDAFECDGGDCSDCAGACLGTDYGTECWDGTYACDEADCPSACADTECTLTMNDAYGDGWNGNVWSSGDQSATIESGSSGEQGMCFDMAAANVYTCDGGAWQSEVSWSLDCADGTTASGGAPASGCFGTCDTVVYGCTDADACNYNVDATDDDGSCYGPDCDGECDSGAVVDDCGECGGDGSACADCAFPTWYDDQYCDSSNNTPECGYDGGDCCPGDCPEGGGNNPGSYTCENNGGDCLDCLDPDSADNQDGGECFDMALGCTDPYADNYNPDANTDDGSCLYDGCAEGSTLGCSDQDIADGDCAVDGWIGDGYCDGYEEAYGVNFCCYDNDGGDCTEAECEATPDWEAVITNLTAEGVDFDVYGDGSVLAPAVSWDWDDVSDGTSCEDNGQVTCSDGSCADTADDCPEDPYPYCTGNLGWIGDGYCDSINNNVDCGYDAGDCCPGDCVDSDAYDCATFGGTCATCVDPDSADLAVGGQCDDYEEWTDDQCAATLTVAGGDGENDCYTDGTAYYVFNWDGGCLATMIIYSGGELDLSAYGFTAGFTFYGFDIGAVEDFIVMFGDAVSDAEGVAADCTEAPACTDAQFDCGDGQCIPLSYVCDGSNEFCNASWGPDCANGADEGLELCGYTDDCTDDMTCADTGCGYYLNYGYTCEQLVGNYGYDCSLCEAEGACDAEYACSDDQYDCGEDNGGCIPASWECDIDWCDCTDCVDESDCDGREDVASNREAISTNSDVNEKVHGYAIASYKMSLITKPDVDVTPVATTIVNIVTGEVTSTGGEGSRDVSYTLNVSCDACLSGGPYSGSFSTGSESEITIYGFDDGSNACGNVVASSTELGDTVPSEDACANAGGEDACEFLDCSGADACGYESWVGDGYCDDGTYGLYFDCDEFECDGGDCLDECGVCSGDGSSCACTAGDVNDDDDVNVQDIVVIVGYILDGSGADAVEACGDANGDGVVNVQDIVVIVNAILGGRTTADATDASLNINNGMVSLDANGFVGAVQMTLSHGAGFTIELTSKAMVADYRTNGNSTTLIIVAPESDELFSASGDFTIEEMIVANENSQVTVGMPTELTLSEAYPNPFNPSTSVNVYVPADGAVSLSVYNVMGQEVATLHSGNMSAGSHTVTWNASDMTSGMYFVRAESSAGVAVQKVMLMK